MNHKSLLSLAAAVGLTISGCGAVAGSGGEAANSREQAASPSGPASASTGVPSHAKPVWLDDLQMISATTGWALIWTSDPGLSSPAFLAPARTTDGGRTWTAVAPLALRTSPASIALLQAASSQHAWIATVAARGNIFVFGTSDEGRTWQQSAPIPRSDLVALDFADARNGWLLASLGAAMQQNPVRLYRTSDGGKHWLLVAKSALSESARADPSGLPVACAKSGLAFTATGAGWITSSCNLLSYSVLVSRDYGLHWASQSLPVPASTCRLNGCTIRAPQIAGHTTFLQIGEYPHTAYLLVSRDGGATWLAASLPRGAGPYARVRFFGPVRGIAVPAGPQGATGRVVYLTSDGGHSWSAVRQGRVFSQPGVSFDFVSQSTGFAWIAGADSPGGPPPVYQTTDSGRTWTSFAPSQPASN